VAIVNRTRVAGCVIALLAGCGKLSGFGGAPPPLVTFQFTVTGDLAPLRPQGVTSERALQVALVWGAQWLTEPFCFVPPPASDAAEAGPVIAMGCRDPFGFVPNRVAANVPVTIGDTTALSLYDLPSADVMVGPITARIAYGSLVVYDDRDGSGTLELSQPHRTAAGGRGPPMEEITDSADVVYGASFLSMTLPDQRIALLEGTFDGTAAFYPRNGCDPPPAAFSVLTAGGFSDAEGRASSLAGRLPMEDRTACGQADPRDAVVTIAVQAPASVREVSCVERANDSSTRYREPPGDAPDLSGRLTACAHLPSFDAGNQSSLIQLVVSGRAQDRCMGLTHYTLRGCRENVSCAVPDWDFTATPPAWWPCPT
jgi:hypothetical protein